MEQKDRLIEERRQLESQLSQGDYKVIKCAEAKAAGVELPYDAEQLHAERQAVRDRINAIEEELREIEDEIQADEPLDTPNEEEI